MTDAKNTLLPQLQYVTTDGYAICILFSYNGTNVYLIPKDRKVAYANIKFISIMPFNFFSQIKKVNKNFIQKNKTLKFNNYIIIGGDILLDDNSNLQLYDDNYIFLEIFKKVLCNEKKIELKINRDLFEKLKETCMTKYHHLGYLELNDFIIGNSIYIPSLEFKTRLDYIINSEIRDKDTLYVKLTPSINDIERLHINPIAEKINTISLNMNAIGFIKKDEDTIIYKSKFNETELEII